jgi:hypothetical protein
MGGGGVIQGTVSEEWGKMLLKPKLGHRLVLSYFPMVYHSIADPDHLDSGPHPTFHL